MTVKDLMTSEVGSCNKNHSLQDVAKLMEECDCGMIPIVESNGRRKAIGTITDRDIAIRAVARGKNPMELNAGDIMSSNPVTIHQDADSDEAQDLMAQNQLRRLIVVDDNGDCVGVLSQADIALGGSEQEAGRVVEEISKPSQQPRQ